jgi:DNA-binding GntR family transcriptional regulator
MTSTSRIAPTVSAPKGKPATAAQEAARHIRNLIFEGQLRPGQAVPPAKVAADLGISRIPVREAIVALEQQGLLTIIPHRGAFVTAMDGRSVLDHFELFGVVYGLAAQRTAERATPEEVARLRVAQTELAAAEDPTEVRQRTLAFNEIILDVGGSPRTRAIARMMHGLLPGNMFELIPQTIAGQKRGAAAVVRAVRQRDGDKAFSACREMMRGHGEQARAWLLAQGVIEP